MTEIIEQEQQNTARPRDRKRVICPLCGHVSGQVSSPDGEFELKCGKCIRFPFCGEPMLLYLVWDRNKEVADLMWASVTREHKAQNRETRCSIPGKRKAFIRCDDHNRCEKCPWGRRPEERERSTISLETIPEDWIGWTGTASPVEEEALLRADLERALAHLKQVNRAAWLAWKMKHIEGMDTKEIGAALQYSPMSVYRLLRIANRILADDLKEEEYA